MTVRKMADHQVLTWVPDWSTEAAFDATAKRAGGLKYNAKLAKGPVSYPVAEAAKTNEFVRLEIR
jgi:hypothetical protein